ncbi:hypothetical protein P3T23_009646 [Paraburkholderia sp. GAS448]|uniref:hypothetical protein n=1 Tax=Paraburkholderia sp. GAS448 TaxID=3035136 RepID=UPI003D20A10E
MVFPRGTILLSIMDFSLALQFFALMLALISIALVPVVMRRDPAPVRSIVRIDVLPHPEWPGLLTRVGAGCLLASFVVLLAGCYLLLAT